MKTCFLSIDVESSYALSKGALDQEPFKGVEETYKILDIFKKHNANATLFVTGNVLGKYPDLVKSWSKDFEIACHNYTHKPLNELKLDARTKELSDFIEIYQKIFKSRPRGFRAPRNIIDNEQFGLLKDFKFLYDASVFPRYPWWKERYAGYRGRKPVLPYWLSVSRSSGTSSKLLEIPESPAGFSIPLVGTWIRKSSVFIYKLLFLFKAPKFVSFNMHSWDVLDGKYLKQLDKIMGFLKKIGYEFKSGEQIYEQVAKNK